ncbi:MAG TPA: hypothetical protein PK079_02500 [Leptospiraceae bacterium]|nr:hypothetical protein [Leptospiraceae bacterium]HMW04075.1 hypothetical protein [Leptospiraceae bacterium]HMX30858.1 hypothetical protein [Leptospiraceae bacterium]HMY30069.1 hypothetical protein [Leptospiraceae bacterium]HMZ62744.1 hypothetical protein [Leptospiraceae bacterium]
MHFSKTKLILFVIFFSITSHLIFNSIILYTEKTSFIWNQIGNRKIEPKTYDLAILGDSQLMSGVHPTLLKKYLQTESKDWEILYYPRPSEQPEGIYQLLHQFEKSDVKIKNLIVNISPVTTSKNTIVDAHKSLTQNFQPFSTEIIKDLSLNKFYLKNLSGNVYYLLLQVFPLLKLNGNFSNEVRIIPGSEGIQNDKHIESYLNVGFFGNLNLNKEKNNFLSNHLIDQGFYFEWGNYTTYTGDCILRQESLTLPFGIEAAFLNPRNDSLDMWKKIGEYSKEKGIHIYYLYIPFSPEAESKIGSKKNTSPIQISLNSIKAIFGNKSVLEIDSNLFSNEDFRDYTHLNICGMMKLTKQLAKSF